MTVEQAITVSFLAVSLLSFGVQAWAFHRLNKHGQRDGTWRTAVCRVGCAVIYIVVGANAFVGHWATLQVTFVAFCITQATWQANAWLDVRQTRREGAPMTYTWTARPGGYALAPCLQELCREIAAHPQYKYLTNLGELGDVTHQGQGYSSDHNPFIVGPRGSAYPGVGYVRAIDLGGSRNLLLQLRAHLHALYLAHDARIYPYGYGKGPDSLIFDWPPGTGYHVDTGDEGHLHISVNQHNGYSPSPSGWVPALDSRASWGLLPTPAPTPARPKETDMIYRVVGMANGNVFTKDAGCIDKVVSGADAFSIAAMLNQPITALAQLKPITLAQHNAWVSRDPRGAGR